MNKVFKEMEKWVMFAIYGLFILVALNTCNNCNRNADQRNTNKELTKLQNEVDSIYNIIDNVYNKEELDIRMNIQGLEVSKRTLYDWNAIVRTVIRPDDRMNEYDKQISIEKTKLKKLNDGN